MGVFSSHIYIYIDVRVARWKSSRICMALSHYQLSVSCVPENWETGLSVRNTRSRFQVFNEAQTMGYRIPMTMCLIPVTVCYSGNIHGASEYHLRSLLKKLGRPDRELGSVLLLQYRTIIVDRLSARKE